MSMLLGIILVLFFIFLQGFFAASEMSLVSQNRLRLHHLADRKDTKAQMILGFLNKPEKFLATTLVGQNLALITSSTLMNYLVFSISRQYLVDFPHIERYIPIASTLIVFPLIIIFAQIVPMSVSRLNSQILARWFIIPLRAMSFVLYPFVIVFSVVSSQIARLLSAGQTRKPLVSREELRLLFRGEGDITSLDKEGRKMIHEIFDLQNTFAKDIMTPLIDITAAPDNATVGDIIEIIVHTGYSHIPIYHNRIDRIAGVVYAHDLIDITDVGRAIQDLIKTPYIVPETKPVFEILMEFRQNNKHLAFAVDEYGGVTGLLTIEDIVEEIVGDISDEYDEPVAPEVAPVKDMITVDGSINISEVEEMYNVKIPRKGVETIGGFVAASIGRIPKRGERFVISGFEFEILDSTDRKVRRVAIKALTSRKTDDKNK